MKPTLPEDRDLEKMSSEVSERYRASPQDEPPARLDAAVLAAARREVKQLRHRRAWQMPASIAAMLVIGISLVLLVRENEPPLPSFSQPAEEAKLAKAVPPAMKAQPRAKADSDREDRPSRERSARPNREPIARDEMAAKQQNSASGTLAAPAATPAAPGVAEPAKSVVNQEASRIGETGDFSPSKKAGAPADADTRSRPGAPALHREDAAAVPPIPPEEWLAKVEELVRDGRQAEARGQLLEFRKQYPHFPLPERLQPLLPPDQR